MRPPMHHYKFVYDTEGDHLLYRPCAGLDSHIERVEQSRV